MEVFKFTSAFITNEKLAELEKGKLKENLCIFFILKVEIEYIYIYIYNSYHECPWKDPWRLQPLLPFVTKLSRKRLQFILPQGWKLFHGQL